MATKSFAINTEPHVAKIGDVEISFQAEVVGAEFAQAYAGLREAQKQIKAAGDDVSPEALIAVNTEMRAFVTGFMLPESREVFNEMRIPDRVLVQLLEWVAELYGGGGGSKENPTDAPGGPSSAS